MSTPVHAPVPLRSTKDGVWRRRCIDRLDTRDGPTSRGASGRFVGELFVIPRGVCHCPHSAPGATIDLPEGVGVVDAGGAGEQLTAPVDRWLD